MPLTQEEHPFLIVGYYADVIALTTASALRLRDFGQVLDLKSRGITQIVSFNFLGQFHSTKTNNAFHEPFISIEMKL
jgi:hypothetical protein